MILKYAKFKNIKLTHNSNTFFLFLFYPFFMYYKTYLFLTLWVLYYLYFCPAFFIYYCTIINSKMLPQPVTIESFTESFSLL